MGKLFKNLTNDGLENQGDRLGGGFEAFPSNIYEAEIKMAYAGESARGASNVTVILDIDGKELRETIYSTNAKGENFYTDKNDPKKKLPLPGYTTIDDMCLLATGEELADQDTEPKMVKIYDFDQRKEVPTEVPVLTGLLGQKIKVGVLRVIENKQKRGDDGNYHATDETRTINQIDKVFSAESNLTVNEYRHEIETPEFYNAWDERNSGKDRDRTNRAGGASAGSSGSGRPGGAGESKPKKKLFGK